MRILRDYVLKEFFQSFFLTLVVFTFVFLVGNVITLANYIINKGVDALSVLKLFAYLFTFCRFFDVISALQSLNRSTSSSPASAASLLTAESVAS